MSLPLQIKDDSGLRVRTVPAPFRLGERGDLGTATSLVIDGRTIPIAGPIDAPIERVASEIARVPAALRDVLNLVAIKAEPNPADPAWAKIYGLPVRSAMGAVASGNGQVLVYPRGIEQLDAADGDAFVRGLMHELGHCWSLRAWADDPSAKEAWIAAIAGDSGAPSRYAVESFANSGRPDEDAAETTALCFLVLGTEAFAEHRSKMPNRFALIAARFDAVAR